VEKLWRSGSGEGGEKDQQLGTNYIKLVTTSVDGDVNVSSEVAGETCNLATLK